MVIIRKNIFALIIGIIFFCVMFIFNTSRSNYFSKIYSRLPNSIVKYCVVNGDEKDDISEQDKQAVNSLFSNIFQSERKGIRKGSGVYSIPGITIQFILDDGSSFEVYFSILEEINGINVIFTEKNKADGFQVILSHEKFEKCYEEIKLLKNKYRHVETQ